MSKKKVYYILANGIGHVTADSDGGVESFAASKASATRFPSVNAALTFITKATKVANEKALKHGWGLTYLSNDLRLVRVEETPGDRVVGLVSTSMIDPTKPVALYNKRKQQYLVHIAAGMVSALTINDAQVYDTLSAAVSAPRAGCTVGLPEEIEVHQVSVSIGPVKITETVLQ